MVTPEQPAGNAPVIFRILLAIVFAVPGVIGLLILGYMCVAWMMEGFRFLDADRDFMQIFIIISMCLITLSVVLIGIVLRYARWLKAPVASLGLAILMVCSVVLATGMFEGLIAEGDSGSWELLMVGAAAGIVVGALPPFFHWWKAK